MDTDKIKVIMRLFEESQISRLDIQDGDLKITLEKNIEPIQYVENSSVVINDKEVNKEIEGISIKSPLVGTFYAASGQDKEPFVTVGSHINEGDTVCIIEAMKVMNEIKSQVSGTVISIDVKDGHTVEFDQILITVG